MLVAADENPADLTAALSVSVHTTRWLPGLRHAVTASKHWLSSAAGVVDCVPASITGLLSYATIFGMVPIVSQVHSRQADSIRLFGMLHSAGWNFS